MSVKLDFKKGEREGDPQRMVDYQSMVRKFLLSVTLTVFIPVLMQMSVSKEGFPVLLYQVLLSIINVIIIIMHASTSKVTYNLTLVSIQVLINLSLFIYIVVSCQ